MTSPWPVVKLENVLRRVSRAERVDPSGEYRLLGVRLDGNGPFLRETVAGARSSASTLSKVEAGDFIYSRLFAWRGAFGVVPAALHGCHASGEFPTFLPKPNRIDVDFLRYWFRLRSTLDRVGADCSGSTPLTRNRFKEHFFLALEIPLPPLEEQRRLVATLDALSTKVAEARSLRESGAAERRRLLSAMAHRADLSAAAKAEQGWRRVKLGDVLSQVTDEHAVRTDGSYPNLGIYSYARGLFPKPPIEGLATSATKLNRVRNGQFIYSRLFAFEGAYGMVGPAFDGCFVSGEYPAFECDQSSITPEFLVAYFQAPTAWAEVAAGSKGLGHRRQRVQPGHLLNHVLELPPRDWQDRIAAVMREGQEVGALSAALGKQLDALMPTILHRAFRGEL